MMCKLTKTSVNDEDKGGTFQVVCTVHNWGFPLGVEVPEHGLCPIGEGEKLRDEAPTD